MIHWYNPEEIWEILLQLQHTETLAWTGLRLHFVLICVRFSRVILVLRSSPQDVLSRQRKPYLRQVDKYQVK